MAKTSVPPKTMLEAAQRQTIHPGTPEMENYLAAGYGLTIDEAKTIVQEWEKDHRSWPLEEVRKAKAMLAAFNAKPRAIDTEPAWQRDESEE